MRQRIPRKGRIVLFAQKIKALRKQRGMTQAQLAREVGLSQQAVGKWETGRSSPDPQMLQFLADLFSVSLDTLIGRQGGSVSCWEEEHQEYMIPIVGTVKAGYNALAFEENYGAEPASVKNPEEYFYLIVRGDSMAPRIASGDLALVHQQREVDSGDLAVVLVDGEEGTLKKVVKQNGAVILQPFNPNYETQVYIGRDIKRLSIVGKVVETKSKW